MNETSLMGEGLPHQPKPECNLEETFSNEWQSYKTDLKRPNIGGTTEVLLQIHGFSNVNLHFNTFF